MGGASGLDLFGGNFFPTRMMAAISHYPASLLVCWFVGGGRGRAASSARHGKSSCSTLLVFVLR
jgi:hypothetical protein